MYGVPTGVNDIRCRHRNMFVNSAVYTKVYGLSLKVNKAESSLGQ